MIDGRWILAVAVVVALHWIVPRAHRRPFNVAAALSLLAFASPPAALALAGATAVAFAGTRSAAPARTTAGLVAIGAAFAIAKLLGSDLSDDATGTATLLGFAFTAPRVAHLLIDVRSGRLRPPSFTDVCSYLWYWPLLVIGPIHRYQDHEREFRRHRPDVGLFGQGVERIIVGLFSVVVIANVVVSQWMSDWVDRLDPGREGLVSFLRSVEYGANLYAAFAGWSAVAIGVANLEGIRVLPNFDRPFLQPNIAAFWQGWHISLTRWATDYLYRPAVANWRNHFVAVTVTMVSIGLWHEFAVRYLIWGGYHALGLAAHRWYASRRDAGAVGPLRRLGSTGLTVVFVMVGFTITRTASLGEMVDEFAALVVGGW